MKSLKNEKLVDDVLVAHDELKKYVTSNSSVVATRVLFFSLKGETKKNELVIKLYAPIRIDTSTRVTTCLVGSFVCYVDFSCLCDGHLVYGYDEFQAVEFASDLDPVLRALGDRCNLYFGDGIECVFYFDDACNRW